jgi:hypothetical protein
MTASSCPGSLLTCVAVCFVVCPLQEQRRVTLVTLAAVVVFVIVGTINLTGVVNRQQLW